MKLTASTQVLAVCAFACTAAAGSKLPPYAFEHTAGRDRPPYALDVASLPVEAQKVWNALHVGMTRQELEKWVSQDVALLHPLGPRYLLPGTGVARGNKFPIKVEITFRPAGMDVATFADSAGRDAWFRHHRPIHEDPQDIVEKIGNPYLVDFPVED